MFDPETCLIALYVLVDTFCKAHVPPTPPKPGRKPSLSVSEVVTLAIFGQWAMFGSERGYLRWADRHLRPLFPTLPHPSQVNRLQQQHQAVITAFAVHLGQQLIDPQERYEILDGTGLAVRNDRRGGSGWLPEIEEIGSCRRLGWFEGFRLLVCAGERGVVTGWGCGSARTGERALVDTLFEARILPQPELPSAGITMGSCYLADMGFSGEACQQRWRDLYGAVVVSPPQRGSHQAWDETWTRDLARIRQVIESVFGRLLHPFRLEHERPHTLGGFQARLAAKMALHNACIWFNRQAGQPDLAIANLVAW
jgi:hypothetical protein